ncbi:hypothetical protein PIB30_010450 [Stylosanthes scabra]|uniref:Uncharacterized protein n=1 Tax=Stylosanthes scabra TaxID=79078 RepID=A0ABU6Y2M5_9FABA|nr:hypothetical protein [Stylosanthes scabra]
MLVYHVATICSAIARGANPSLVTATFLIFFSLISFEAILWVLLPLPPHCPLSSFIIVNVIILLVAIISHYNDIYNLLTTRSHASSDTVASQAWNYENSLPPSHHFLVYKQPIGEQGVKGRGRPKKTIHEVAKRDLHVNG